MRTRSLRAARWCLVGVIAAAAPFAPAQGPTERPVAPDELPPIPDVRELLATVDETPIYADEIEPLPVAKQARVEEPGTAGFERWLDATRRNNLQARVIQLIQARMSEQAGIVATEQEIQAVRDFRDRQQRLRLEERIAMRDGLENEVAMIRSAGDEPPDEVLLELRRLRSEVALLEKTLSGREPRTRDAERSHELAERRFADNAVRSWKFTRLLHEKYGGKVLQMGPNAEPIEAYSLLFKEELDAGRLTFETEWARASVIDAFDSMLPQLVDPLPDAFQVPWWQSDLTAEEIEAANSAAQ